MDPTIINPSTASVLANGIGPEGLLILGAIYFIIPALFVVFIEAGAVWFVARSRFRRTLTIVFYANAASFLAGIPVMFFFARLFDKLPTDLHAYFEAYPKFCIQKYLTYFVISVIVEAVIAVRWLARDGAASRVRVLLGVVLGNVLTYSALCPAHYYGMRPTYLGAHFSADSTWARADSGKIVYVDLDSRQLKSIDADGRNREMLVPHAMTAYILSRDLTKCLFVDRDRFYYWRGGVSEAPREIGPAYPRERFAPTATADFSPSGDLIAYVAVTHRPSSFNYDYELHLVDIRANRDVVIDKAADVKRIPAVYWSDQEKTLWLRVVEGVDSRLDWGDDPSKATKEPGMIDPTHLAGHYESGEYRWRAYNDVVSEDDLPNLHAKIYNTLSNSYAIITRDQNYHRRGEGIVIEIADNPGIALLSNHRYFGDIGFIPNTHLCVLDDETFGALYLMDSDTQAVGKITAGAKFLLFSEKYRKKPPARWDG